jgi:hypothetical protein
MKYYVVFIPVCAGEPKLSKKGEVAGRFEQLQNEAVKAHIAQQGF